MRHSSRVIRDLYIYMYNVPFELHLSNNVRSICISHAFIQTLQLQCLRGIFSCGNMLKPLCVASIEYSTKPKTFERNKKNTA